MTDYNSLDKKYIEAFEGYRVEEHSSKIKDNLLDKMLKDEMLEFASMHDIDVNNRLTKAEIADEMIRSGIYEKIIGKQEGKEEKEIEKIEPEKLSEMLERPFSETLSRTPMMDYKSIEEMWNNVMGDVEYNMKKYTENNIQYWESMEDQWIDKAQEFQNKIEELSTAPVDVQDYKEFSVIWRNFYNKMSARFMKITREMNETQNSIFETISDYNSRANEILRQENPDMTEMSNLWFDMTSDLRSEMEDMREILDVGQNQFENTWNRFSRKTVDMMDKMRGAQSRQIDELNDMWMSNFNDMNNYLNSAFEEYRNVYDTMMENMAKQGENFVESVMDMAKQYEEDYTTMLEEYIKMLQTNYEKMFKSSSYEQLRELKKRLSRLEKKM